MNTTVKRIVQQSADGDAWGDTMTSLFGLAETIYVLGFDVPSELQFRASPLLSLASVREFPEEHDIATELLAAVDDNTVSVGELQYAARVVNRAADILRAQGRDY